MEEWEGWVGGGLRCHSVEVLDGFYELSTGTHLIKQNVRGSSCFAEFKVSVPAEWPHLLIPYKYTCQYQLHVKVQRGEDRGVEVEENKALLFPLLSAGVALLKVLGPAAQSPSKELQ